MKQLMEKYFEGEVPSADQLAGLMVQAITNGSLVPILFISTAKQVGVDELLDFVATSAPSPAAVVRKAKDGSELKPDPSGPICAQVFRTRIDPFVQKLNFIRVYSGTLKKDDTVPASTSRKGVKLAQLLSVQASETKADGRCWTGRDLRGGQGGRAAHRDHHRRD